jgi:hypothetical protein
MKDTEKPSEPTEKERMEAFSKELSMLVRATRGLSPESDSVISKLIDVKNADERSRFPTYPFVGRQVYLRLLHKKFPEYAKACKVWADAEASALIAYKGQGRKEWVEASRIMTLGENQQSFNFGPQQQPQPEKRGFLRRKPKPEPSEFENE